jgi:hypothetical protein
MRYLDIVAIVRDERYLEEWVRYHLLLGVERITLFDNESVKPAEEDLEEYTSTGKVVVIPIGGRGRQQEAYTFATRWLARETSWVGCIDADEFLVPHHCDDVRSLLEDFDYGGYGGVAFNWATFGPNGHSKKPGLPQMIAYTTRAPDRFTHHRHVKSFVRPKAVRHWMNPHRAAMYKPFVTVDEESREVRTDAWTHGMPSYRLAQINHYHTRSGEDWAEKVVRGRGDMLKTVRLERFHRFSRLTTVEDRSIERFARILYPEHFTDVPNISEDRQQA